MDQFFVSLMPMICGSSLLIIILSSSICGRRENMFRDIIFNLFATKGDTMLLLAQCFVDQHYLRAQSTVYITADTLQPEF